MYNSANIKANSQKPRKGPISCWPFYLEKQTPRGRTPPTVGKRRGRAVWGVCFYPQRGLCLEQDTFLDGSLPIDEAALDVLSRIAKAKEDENRLRQSETNILRRREQMALNEIEETAKLRHEVQRLILELDKLGEQIGASIAAQQLQAAQIKALREDVGKIDDNMVLLLTEHSPQAVRVAIDETSQRKLIRQHRKNLEKLLEEAATFGSGNEPLKLKNQIEREQQALDDLEG